MLNYKEFRSAICVLKTSLWSSRFEFKISPEKCFIVNHETESQRTTGQTQMLLLSGLHGGSAPTLLRTCDANWTDRVVLFLLIDWFVTESTTTHSDMPPRKACGSDYTKPVIAVTVAASVFFFAATPAVVCDTKEQRQRTQARPCMMCMREHGREDAIAAAPFARTVARYFPPE